MGRALSNRRFYSLLNKEECKSILRCTPICTPVSVQLAVTEDDIVKLPLATGNPDSIELEIRQMTENKLLSSSRNLETLFSMIRGIVRKGPVAVKAL